MPWIQNVALSDIKKGRHYDPGPNNLLIQIVDTGMEFPEPHYKFNTVHQFQFLDLERDDKCIEPEMKITDDQAKSLVSSGHVVDAPLAFMSGEKEKGGNEEG